jgi:hypothetical protein
VCVVVDVCVRVSVDVGVGVCVGLDVCVGVDVVKLGSTNSGDGIISCTTSTKAIAPSSVFKEDKSS